MRSDLERLDLFAKEVVAATPAMQQQVGEVIHRDKLQTDRASELKRKCYSVGIEEVKLPDGFVLFTAGPVYVTCTIVADLLKTFFDTVGYKPSDCLLYSFKTPVIELSKAPASSGWDKLLEAIPQPVFGDFVKFMLSQRFRISRGKEDREYWGVRLEQVQLPIPNPVGKSLYVFLPSGSKWLLRTVGGNLPLQFMWDSPDKKIIEESIAVDRLG